MSIGILKDTIRTIPNYPRSGILFYDITPILSNPDTLSVVIDMLAERHKDDVPTKIVGVESRGFIFGVPLAYKLNIGFVPIRKKGKLPYKTYEASYTLEYGEASIEIHQDALNSNDRVIVVDDLLATGGTSKAAAELVSMFGSEIISLDFVIELLDLKGRNNITEYRINSLLQF